MNPVNSAKNIAEMNGVQQRRKMAAKKETGLGVIGKGQTSHKTWMEGPPWIQKSGNKFKTGTITTKYIKSKTYPANWIMNEHTGRYEAPKTKK